MPNYQNGKIYTVRNYADNTLIYVGSTIQSLSRRLSKHRSDCRAGCGIALYSHIVDNDWTNWYIELYEYYPCNNKTELERREGQIIREIGTINKMVAGRTYKERYEENAEKIKENLKKYRKENADKIKEYQKENADKIKEYQKEYRKENADKIKEYYKNNVDKIKEYREEKECCDICGAFMRSDSINRHQKSKKCMDIRE